MPKFRDISGERFGRLVVIGMSHKVRRSAYWDCVCDCGSLKNVKGLHLKAGSIRSCGCLRVEATRANKTTHGKRHTRLYGTWSRIRQRCENKNDNRYKSYGGRGIRVCRRWQSFENFYADMAGTWFEGASIEREKVNGNYEPSNCTWIPRRDQAKNRQSSIFIDTPWGRLNAIYVAKKLGLSPGTFYERIKTWPKERWLEPRHH